jgi:phosphoribosyl-AMP cyclohydrolase / phosphoribosyl-ATP pyrophosphohydrolase
VAWKDLEDDEEPAKPAAAPAPVAPANGGQPRKGTVIEVDDEPPTMAPAKAKAAAVEEGVEVVAKGPSKFSLADLEVLKAAIKVKGAGVVIEGINLDELKYDAEGLVPIVAQDRRTGAVLQLGWGNKETLESSLRTKQMSYWSREHGKAIGKGEGSGHPQRLVQMRVDCDKDALLALVDQDGPACHLDKGTCWTDGRTPPVATFLGELDRQVQAEAKAPKPGSDVAKLLSEPLGALKAFVEDANTVTRSLQGKQGAKAVEHGAADALYHLIVAMRAKGVGFDKVVTELFARQLAEEMNKK